MNRYEPFEHQLVDDMADFKERLELSANQHLTDIADIAIAPESNPRHTRNKHKRLRLPVFIRAFLKGILVVLRSVTKLPGFWVWGSRESHEYQPAGQTFATQGGGAEDPVKLLGAATADQQMEIFD